MNDQPRTQPFPPHPNGDLYVFSVFQTVQGEGPFAGEPATFIRLSGCNLQCPGCDTDYTGGGWLLPGDLVAAARGSEGTRRIPDTRVREPLVVITGGEPLAQHIGPSIIALLDAGFRVQVETNGTLYVPAPWSRVTVVCSPKAPQVHPKLAPHINAYKYVLSHGDIDERDGLPSRVLGSAFRPARPPKWYGGTVYVQPADEHSDVRNRLNRKATIESAMRYGYTLSLQLHKILEME